MPSLRIKGKRIMIPGLLLMIGAALLSSGSSKMTAAPRKQLPGHLQLISLEPLPKDYCQDDAANTGSSLMAAMEQQRADRRVASLLGAVPEQRTALASTNDAARSTAAKRKPLTEIHDSYAAYSALAVDPAHNEIVMVDENTFTVLNYDRLENTPPKAALSEPKRILKGLNTDLEFSCSIYVDPVNGDVYAVNNDTLGRTVVFSRDQKGDVAPIRSLVTPPFTFGLAVDEKHQEMLFTLQDDAAVTTFNKMAKDRDSALRTLQGPRTGLADPHGIVLDTKNDLIYVSNWGTVNVHVAPESGPRDTGRGLGRANFPIGRNNAVLGSGKAYPPSISVYPRTASGDTPPLRVIQGSNTQLNWPTALTMDPEHGELFAVNDPTDSVTVYKADAAGDVAPIRVIKGPKTGLKNPTGVFADLTNNELWVANYGNHSATVYKLDASGDTPPLRVIRSGPANKPAPMMGNPHAVAYDSKRDELLVAN
jgi:DNA-binding beta-propeller fold protein YncE